MEKVDFGGYFGMAHFKWTMNPDIALVLLESSTLTPRAETHLPKWGSGAQAAVDILTEM